MIQLSKAGLFSWGRFAWRELLRLDAWREDARAAERSDDGLDFLVKHALRTAPVSSDASDVLVRLTAMMRGPLGSPALEGPCCSSLDLEMMASGGRFRPAPFAISDYARAPYTRTYKVSESLWEMLRLEASGLPKSGCAWLLT